MKYLSELEIFENYKIISYNRKIEVGLLMEESTVHMRIHQLKTRVNNFLEIVGKDLFYSIVEKKLKERTDLPYKYMNFNEMQMKYFMQPNTIKSIYARQ
jgi:hypothetical protein